MTRKQPASPAKTDDRVRQQGSSIVLLEGELHDGAGGVFATGSSGGLLYGVEKVRFPASVATGSAVRPRQSIEAATFTDKGLRVTFNNVTECEGLARPAEVAQTINVLLEKAASGAALQTRQKSG
jgi:hypothetical protein